MIITIEIPEGQEDKVRQLLGEAADRAIRARDNCPLMHRDPTSPRHDWYHVAQAISAAYRSIPTTEKDTSMDIVYCPHCGFDGTEGEVDEHRANNHQDEPQKGSNLKHRPKD